MRLPHLPVLLLAFRLLASAEEVTVIVTPPAPDAGVRLTAAQRDAVRVRPVLLAQPRGDQPLLDGLAALAAEDSALWGLRIGDIPAAGWYAEGGLGTLRVGVGNKVESRVEGLASYLDRRGEGPEVVVMTLSSLDLPSGTRVEAPFVQYAATMEVRMTSAKLQGSFVDTISAPRVLPNGTVIPGLPFPIELPNLSVDEVHTRVTVPAGVGLTDELRPAPTPVAQRTKAPRDPRVAWPDLRDGFAAMGAAHPGKVMVLTTMPLETSDNLQRNWFNHQVRAHAATSKAPLFDIAAMQSRRADGSVAQDDQGEVLAPEWSERSRGGGMNEAGKRRLGQAWWGFLAALPVPAPTMSSEK